MRKRSNLALWRAACCGLVAMMVGLTWLPGATGLGPAAATAQVDDASDEEPADEEPADAPPAKKAAAEEDGPRMATDNLLLWTYRSLGIPYTVAFLAMSFIYVALLVMNILSTRRNTVVPAALIEAFETHLNAKEYQAAYDQAKNDESFLGQVLSAGLAKLSRGYNPAIEAMQEVGEEENMKMEHSLSYIALIGVISPMVGLLGTVHGMIMSFSVIANSTVQPKPYELAEGIATALFTTLVGLLIAIPAIASHYILRNRVARLVLEVGIVSEDLMSRFSNVGKKE